MAAALSYSLHFNCFGARSCAINATCRVGNSEHFPAAIGSVFVAALRTFTSINFERYRAGVPFHAAIAQAPDGIIACVCLGITKYQLRISTLD
ncbi:hypothetical protein ACVIHH_008247 [Bradyrhizobium sp. USDA 4518]